MDPLPSPADADFGWYFAYGSNLSKERIQLRTGILPKARLAYLKGYRLAFNLYADEAIFANIVPCSQSLVWGVAYWCNREMMAALDRYEAVEIDCYRRIWVEVETETGEILRAETYLGGPGFLVENGVPQDSYLHFILTGAQEHNLPEFYIKQLPILGGRSVQPRIIS